MDKNIYECSLCGYQYDPAAGDPERGIAPGTPFSELPEDWCCPLCGATKEMFVPCSDQEKSPPTDDEEKVREYQNKDIAIFWYPHICSHAGKCWKGLPQVFDPEKRPWINVDGSSAEDIIRIIDTCPSQALKYGIPTGSSVDPAQPKGPGWIDYRIDPEKAIQIRVIKDGPLLITGPTRLLDSQGIILKESDRLVLCRCGKSKNPPFCDGSHIEKE